jgi:hypothetical protein
MVFKTSLICPPVWGVILVKVILKNVTRLKMGLHGIYFSLVKGLSKMTFLHLKLNALRIDRSCFHARMPSDLFSQIKLIFWVTLWGFIFLFLFCFVFFFQVFYVCVYLSKELLEFPKCICFGQISTRFLFLYSFWRSQKISLKTYENMYRFWKKRKHRRILRVVVLWAKVVLKMLFTCNNNKKECDMNTG